ncbi:MAG TPA: hypothetical protein VFR85_01325 [Anaeromyxobacteraceae bacterium]|nr:hypothetical protein [Anaeromyxobacteraceae bacterium]
MQPEPGTDLAGVRQAQLDRKLSDIAWGLLVLVTGIVWVVPRDRVPEGAWLLGVAAVLLGVNVVRALAHITVNAFSLVLGLAALSAALTRLWRPDLPLLGICLVVIGASLVLKPLFTKAT